jgi:hypothetical protein
MKIFHSAAFWLFAALFLFFANGGVEAQTGRAEKIVSIRGKVLALKGEDLWVAAPNGEVKVKIPDQGLIRQEVAMKLSDIAPGMYLGATAEKQPDGMFRASEVHVFSEDQRGFGEGHRPSSSNPGSTMTNANVEKVEDAAVQDIKGRVMSLKFKEGEVKVFVPPNIPIVKWMAVGPEMVKPGAEVNARAAQGPDGSLTAVQVTLRAQK